MAALFQLNFLRTRDFWTKLSTQWTLLGLFLVFFWKSVYRAHYLYGERTDLWICIRAAKRLLAQEAVYVGDLWAHTKPPFATLFFVPFSYIPFPILSGLWDLLNLSLYFALAYSFAKQIRQAWGCNLFYTTLGGLIVILNFWGYELRFGQYNMLTLAMIWFGSRSRHSWVGTFMFWLAFFIKPSNLLFLPWFLKKHKFQWTQVLIESMSLALVLCLSYGLLFGFKEIFIHHLEWLRFMPHTTAKYMMRDVNFGLPLFFGYFTLASWPQHLLLVLFLAWGFAWALKEINEFKVFAVLSVLSVLASPMVWWATFVFFLPYSLWLIAQSWFFWNKGKKTASIIGFLLVILSTQLIFPNPLMKYIHRLSNPSIFYFLYLIWDYIRLRSAKTLVGTSTWLK